MQTDSKGNYVINTGADIALGMKNKETGQYPGKISPSVVATPEQVQIALNSNIPVSEKLAIIAGAKYNTEGDWSVQGGLKGQLSDMLNINATAGYDSKTGSTGNIALQALLNQQKRTPNPKFAAKKPTLSTTEIKPLDLKNYQLQNKEKGGTVSKNLVEVEGGEAYETPNGEVGEFVGPDHTDDPTKESGIKFQVGDENSNITNKIIPEGTEIYSKKISKNGKTMANQKLKSAKYIKSLEEKYKENPSPLNFNTLARAKEVAAIQDAANQQIQEEVKALENLKGLESYLAKYGGRVGNNYANGGNIEPPPTNNVSNIDRKMGLNDFPYSETAAQEYWQTKWFNDQNSKWMTNQMQEIQKNDLNFEVNRRKKPKTNLIEYNQMWNDMGAYENGGKITKYDFGDPDLKNPDDKEEEEIYLTEGDKKGQLGEAISMVGPLATTVANQLGTDPNINHWERFGQESLSTLEAQKGFLGQQFKNQEAKIGEMVRNQIRDNSGKFRGLAGLRQANLTATRAGGKMMNDAYLNFAQGMMGLNNQIASMQLSADTKRTAGAEAADLANRMDDDNFYTNLSKDIGNVGAGLQASGKNLNVKEMDKDINAIMDKLSPFGIKLKRNKKGGFDYVSSDGKTMTEEEVQEMLKKKAEEARIKREAEAAAAAKKEGEKTTSTD